MVSRSVKIRVFYHTLSTRIMSSRVAFLLCTLAVVSAFAPLRTTPLRSSTKVGAAWLPTDEAIAAWKKEYPSIYAAGWGPTTKAERWNGRHAMFGWIALLATGYAKAHGLIPNPDTLLDTKTWGSLAYLYGGSITNERAIIIVGHLHLLMLSVCAAVAPLSGQDKLYLEKGEEHEPAAGLFVKASPGLNPGAEMQNGRLAMLGLIALVGQSVMTQTPILDVISTGTGHVFF